MRFLPATMRECGNLSENFRVKSHKINIEENVGESVHRAPFSIGILENVWYNLIILEGF